MRNEEIVIISLFSKVQIYGLGVKQFFLQFLVDINPLDPDPDPQKYADPGSQNLADPTDPKHWTKAIASVILSYPPCKDDNARFTTEP